MNYGTEQWKSLIEGLLDRMGFTDRKIEIDSEHNHGAIFIYDHEALVRDQLPYFIEHLNYIAQLVAKKNHVSPPFFDVNNYRKERETLIGELARTAARKVSATREEIALPAMNSYERRLVHVELAAHPNVSTESVGAGKERYVVVRPITE